MISFVILSYRANNRSKVTVHKLMNLKSRFNLATAINIGREGRYSEQYKNKNSAQLRIHFKSSKYRV
jgi:hypothetical protein